MQIQKWLVLQAQGFNSEAKPKVSVTLAIIEGDPWLTISGVQLPLKFR
jgi:hypothetical protein